MASQKDGSKFMQILSIQIDKPTLRAALLVLKRGSFEIRGLKSALFSHPNDVKQLYTKKFKGEILGALSGKDLFVKKLDLNIGTTRHLYKALAFQSEASSLFPPEEVEHVPYVIKKGKNCVESLLFTASQAALGDLLQDFKSLEIEPDRIGAWSLALVRYVGWKLPLLQDAYIIDLASSLISAVWMEKGELKKSATVEGGVEELLTAYLEDQKKILLLKELEGIAKQVNLKRIFPEEVPLFHQTLTRIRSHLARTILSFYKQGGKKPLIFTGRTDAFLNFKDFLKEGFLEAILSEESSSFPLEELKYAAVIGNALERRLQLRRGKFFPNKRWKNLGKASLALCGASFLLCFGLFSWGSHVLEKREKSLSQTLSSTIYSFDPSLKHPSDDPDALLSFWTRTLETYGKEYPYIVLAPKASEILYWLETAPLLASLSEEANPIVFQNFRYQLINYPHIGASSEPYQAKVELEFEAKSPIIARKFHEYLLKEDKWIDSDKGVSWDFQNGRYQTSFFLKNRSPHV